MVFGGQNGGDRAGIRGEAGLKDHAGFHVLESGDALFEGHVQRHSARNRADRARAGAVFPHGVDGRFAQFGVGGQAQVIVGGEVDYLFAVETGLGRAFRFQDVQALEGAFPAPGLELIVQVGERDAHQPQSNASRL